MHPIDGWMRGRDPAPVVAFRPSPGAAASRSERCSMEEPDFWSSLSMRLTASVARRVQGPDAEDVVQGALMSVWARQAEGDVEDVAAYATRAVERELLNFWRGHRRRAWSWSDGVDLHDVAADESEDGWVGTAAARAWLAEVLSLPAHEHGLSSCQVQILSLLLGGGQPHHCKHRAPRRLRTPPCPVAATFRGGEAEKSARKLVPPRCLWRWGRSRSPGDGAPRC